MDAVAPTFDRVYDYVVVGAGSAGCVLANRLSASGRRTVLLLEAGGSDRRGFASAWIHLPLGYGRTFTDRRVNWMYRTEPEAGLAGRSLHWPRGKVLGGSSSINAMVHIRGFASDYDGWAAGGAPGWSHEEVLPYFERAEAETGGPLELSSRWDDLHPVSRRFVRAGTQIGLPERANVDGVEGVGHYRTTQTRALRLSAARAYLHPARARANLTVLTRAHAARILFEGTRAVGIEFERRGRLQQVRAAREVIVSAGAVATPLLLQRSGIGPPELLARHGIAPLHANPNVGGHLQDHLCIDAILATRVPSLNDELGPLSGRIRAGLRYALAQRGPLVLGINQAGGFMRLDPQAEVPDAQLYFAPISFDIARHAERARLAPDPHSAMLVGVQPCRPTSRGRIVISSARPEAPPSIAPNYLSTEHDVAQIVAAVRAVRRLAAAPALAEIVEAETRPGPDVVTDADMEAYARRWAGTVYHPVGTARMGTDPASSVVDPQLRVHGIAGLRVVDASVFPAITSGNTNAPTIMVAEKAADLVLGGG